MVLSVLWKWMDWVRLKIAARGLAVVAGKGGIAHRSGAKSHGAADKAANLGEWKSKGETTFLSPKQIIA